MSGKDSGCGCAGDGGSEAPCEKPKSKNDCPKPKPSSCEREDNKCHSSQDKFKQQQACKDSKDNCSKKSGDEGKCHSSQKEFHLGCKEESKSKDCASAKESKPKDCASAKEIKPKDCVSAKESKPKDCASAKESKPKDCASAKKSKSKDCASAKESKPKDCASAKTEKPQCETSSYDNVKEGYIKLSDMCKSLAKQALKLRPKSKCSGVDDAVDACGKGLALPPARAPGDPAVESGLGVGQGAKSPCAAKFAGPCPQTRPPSIQDFFPIDARNKKLNDCIEKYTKIDPSQVISKCSRFASRTGHVTEQCAQAVRRGQATCANTVRSSPVARSTVRFLGPRHIQLAQRWLPTAAVYLATTALLTVYVTEWRAALRYVPFYQPSTPEDQED